jgi:hypothetical protein
MNLPAFERHRALEMMAGSCGSGSITTSAFGIRPTAMASLGAAQSRLRIGNEVGRCLNRNCCPCAADARQRRRVGWGPGIQAQLPLSDAGCVFVSRARRSSASRCQSG